MDTYHIVRGARSILLLSISRKRQTSHGERVQELEPSTARLEQAAIGHQTLLSLVGGIRMKPFH